MDDELAALVARDPARYRDCLAPGGEHTCGADVSRSADGPLPIVRNDVLVPSHLASAPVTGHGTTIISKLMSGQRARLRVVGDSGTRSYAPGRPQAREKRWRWVAKAR